MNQETTFKQFGVGTKVFCDFHIGPKPNAVVIEVLAAGTGKDGRVLKEDLQRFAASNGETESKSTESSLDAAKPLTPFQTQMFKTMTNSLNIPHFLFTESISINSLSALRKLALPQPWRRSRRRAP